MLTCHFRDRTFYRCPAGRFGMDKNLSVPAQNSFCVRDSVTVFFRIHLIESLFNQVWFFFYSSFSQSFLPYVLMSRRKKIAQFYKRKRPRLTLDPFPTNEVCTNLLNFFLACRVTWRRNKYPRSFCACLSNTHVAHIAI